MPLVFVEFCRLRGNNFKEISPRKIMVLEKILEGSNPLYQEVKRTKTLEDEVTGRENHYGASRNRGIIGEIFTEIREKVKL